MNHPLRAAALACAVLLACDASAAAQQVQPCADEAERQQAVQHINALRAAGSACGVDAGLACAQRSGTRYERFWVLQLARPAAKR
jgi:outer membrane biogenesis lipoprotein LolB